MPFVTFEGNIVLVSPETMQANGFADGQTIGRADLGPILEGNLAVMLVDENGDAGTGQVVTHGEETLDVRPETMTALKLVEGQNVDEETADRIIRCNYAVLLAVVAKRDAACGKGFADDEGKAPSIDQLVERYRDMPGISAYDKIADDFQAGILTEREAREIAEILFPSVETAAKAAT
jgi:hypothetical protein